MRVYPEVSSDSTCNGWICDESHDFMLHAKSQMRHLKTLPCAFVRLVGVRVCVCVSLSAGLSVMLPTDQQFWKHRSHSLAVREEDEACKWLRVCGMKAGGGWYLTSESKKSFPSPVCVCISVCQCVCRKAQGWLKCVSVARAPVGIYTQWGVEELLWLCPLRRGVEDGGTHSLLNNIAQLFPHTCTCNKQSSLEQALK